MNGEYMGLNNLTEVIEKTTIVLNELESGFNLSVKVLDPAAWTPLVSQLVEIMNETNMQFE